MDATVGWADWRDENKLKWDERVAVHIGPDGYEREPFLTDPTHLSDVVKFDRVRMNGGQSLDGLDVCHLQCHIGTDTLSLSRLGATSLTGLDFSPTALHEARWLFEQTGAIGTFVESDVYDAVSALGTTFDLVYASVGAINWINDIGRWMQVAYDLLRPGGSLYLRDVHPFAMALDPDRQAGEPLRVRFDYFETVEPGTTESDTTYTGDGTKLVNRRDHEWSHGIAEIVGGAMAAGFHLDALYEDDFVDWLAYPDMVKDDATGRYHFPSGYPRVPFYVTVQATKK
jgi:SAM-dependent methyltransferase